MTLFGSKLTFVPIPEAQATGDDEVRAPFQKEHVKDAPKVEADGDLSTEEERQLYEHYGSSDYGAWQGQDRTKDADLPGDAEQPSGEPGVAGVRLRRVIVVAAPPPRT